MNRKKVAILLPWLKMGGTNKVALRFAKELSQYCDVTLVLSQNTGELLSEVPDGVHVLIDELRSFRDIFAEDIKNLSIDFLLKDIHYYANVRAGRDDIDNYSYLASRNPNISEETFDCAISYHGQSPERLVNLVDRIYARKKVVWIHGEMSFSDTFLEKMEKYYAQVDHFFFVSKATRDSFAKFIPFDTAKATVYYNPLDENEILTKALETPEQSFSSQTFNLLTVGRISAEKGQDMIPSIVQNLLDRGYPIHWYLIGDGPNQKKVENLIQEHHVQDYVSLLGVKNNPYCYMRMCDLYVQPSYTEGYSTTICEAGILGKAIIGTKPSGGIRDQIMDGVDGLIVDATIEGLTNGIESLLQNPVLKMQFETEIRKKNFAGKGEVKKFLDIL